MLDRILGLLRRGQDGGGSGPSAPASGKDPAAEQKAAAFSQAIDLANAARDRANAAGVGPDAFREVAALYESALRLNPEDAANQIQCGHMFKEGRMYAEAEAHYDLALALTPDDADLHLQMGHFYRTVGRLVECEGAYLRAAELAPNWSEPRRKLEEIYRAGLLPGPDSPAAGRAQVKVSVGQPVGGRASGFGEQVSGVGLLGALEGLAPELAPRHPDTLFHNHQEMIEVRAFARRERTRWGMSITLRGVEAYRGFCIAAHPILEVWMTVGGQIVYRGGPLAGFPLKSEKDNIYLRKYPFNIWHDFSAFREGRYEVEIFFKDALDNIQSHKEYVMIAAPLPAADHPECDGIVSVSREDPRPIEEQINAQPSVVRPARRSLFSQPPRTVLVVRIDQLGDMVNSVPAMRRLREILPDARLVGLIAPSNVPLAESLGLFDELIAVDIPDDDLEKRRVFPLVEQEKLRKKLEPYGFDLAIDLSHVNMSQPLMFLSNAPFLYGFNPRENPWLSAGIDSVVTHDFVNGLEVGAHATKVLGLVEWLGLLMKSHMTVARRDDLPRSTLAPLGLRDEDRFAVFHAGARITFSRWPYYPQLALKVLQTSGLKVVLVTDDAGLRATLPPELVASDRFILVDNRPGFDVLDALAHHCAVFVGNDSGPKHLAALRGAHVVSIHSSRINWSEWGQEGSGYIISRKVPCAGCRIHHDPEECGANFACINHITVDEVHRAMSEFIV